MAINYFIEPITLGCYMDVLQNKGLVTSRNKKIKIHDLIKFKINSFPGRYFYSDKIYEVNFVTKDLAKDGICMFSATEWNYNLRVMSKLLIDNNISKKHKIMILENAVAAYNGEAEEIALAKYMGAYKDKHL